MTKNPLIHVGVAFALIFVAGGAYAFANYALGTRSARSAALLAEISQMRGEKEAGEEAKRALANADAERAAIRGYFVEPEGVVGFLESVEDTARALGADVTVGSVTEVLNPTQHLTLALKIEGSFTAVMRTIGALEYGPRDIVTTALTLDTDSGPEGATGAWRATMTMDVGARNLKPKP